jgi:DNA-binding LytR/AlgR family response regulator
MARAIIAEDEPLLRREICGTLQALWPQLTICAEVGDGDEALSALERFAPDVIFLDIQMPNLDGLTVAERVNRKVHVVFITAYDQYTLAAFERGAIDYVLKPISPARLGTTVQRLQDRLLTQPPDLTELLQLIREARSVRTSNYVQWLTVPRGSEYKFLTVGEIRYLRADSKYTVLYTKDSEFLLTEALKAVKETLDPAVFWQIHRSVVVNVNAIDTVYRTFRGALELRLKDRPELLPVSAAHAHQFKSR